MFSILKRIPLWVWLIFGFLFLNASTYGWYTSVWNDEVMLSDPAANLYFGHGFTSTAWPQSRAEHWVGNSPLHPLLLFLWFKLVGFGIFQVRVLDYLYWSIAVAVVCLAVRRAGLIRSQPALATLVVMLFSGYALVFNYRSARYDPLIFCVAALCFLAFTISHPGWRRAAIISTAALFLPTALTLGPFAAALGGLVLLVWGRKFFVELCCVALGLIIGFGTIFVYLLWLGMWETYRQVTMYLALSYYPPGQTSPIWQRKLAGLPHKLVSDPTVMVLLLALLAVFFFASKKLDATSRRLVIFGVAGFFFIPALAQATYTYQIYHYWETFVPLAICLLALLERCRNLFSANVKHYSLILLSVVTFALGLGLRLGLESTDINGRDYSKVERFVVSVIRPSDVVMADFQAFYPLHKLQATTYYYPYLHVIKPMEAKTINCLLVQPGQFEAIRKKIGGGWIATGERLTRENKFTVEWLNHIFPNYYRNQSNQKYNLHVYRRALTGIIPP